MILKSTAGKGQNLERKPTESHKGNADEMSENTRGKLRKIKEENVT